MRKMKSGRRFAFGVACLMLSASCFGWWTSDGESPYGKFDAGPVTPSIPFAERQAKPLKVFFTAYGPGQREILELKERFALTPVLFPTYEYKSFSPWSPGAAQIYAPAMSEDTYQEEVVKRLAELKTCDAAVLSHHLPEAMPTNVLAAVMDEVRRGMGLVWIAPLDKPFDIPGVTLAEADVASFFPTDLVPQLKGARVLEGQLGKGRILQVIYPLPPFEIGNKLWQIELGCLECLTPYDSDDPLYYDFCLAFVGQCLWRATAYPSASPVRSERHVYTTYGEEVDATHPTAAARLEVKRDFDAADNVVAYAVAPVKPTPAQIVDVAFPRDGYKPNEPISGRIVLADGVKGDVAVTLTDEHGRDLWRKAFTGVSGEIPLDISFFNPNSMYGCVRVDFFENGVRTDRVYSELYFDTTAEAVRDFTLTMWATAAPKARVMQLALGEMKRCGVDTILNAALSGYATRERYFTMARRMHKLGLYHIPYTTRMALRPILKRMKKDAIQSCECLSYWPDFEAGRLKAPKPNPKTGMYPTVAMNYAAAQKGLGALYYSLGDENGLMAGSRNAADENCFCDACQRRFREYLKRVYGTLEKMNAEYKSDYKTWDEVKALGFVAAVKARRYSLWADFRAFMEDQYIGWHRYESALIKSVDSEARVGEEGMERPEISFMGFRFSDSLQYAEASGPYYTERECHALKYLPPNSPKQAWYGAYVGFSSSPHVRRLPWRHLFSGLNGAAWWYADVLQNGLAFSYSGIFRPDLAPLTPFADSCAEIRFIRESGIGRMFCAAKQANMGVAVHYSNPSMHAATLNPGRTTWEYSHMDFNAVLGECAQAYEFLAPREIENGIPEWVKVFVMPDSQAMSDREVEAVQAFMRRGGLAIADELPGEMNEHCTLRPANPFGEAFKAKPLEPVRVGAGYAVNVGRTYADLEERVAANTAGGIAAGFQRLLDLVDAKPPVVVTDEASSLRRADVFNLYDVMLVGMLGPMPSQGKMKAGAGAEAGMQTSAAVGGSLVRILRTDKPRWAYDLGRKGAGACLGHGTSFQITLEPACGRVIAFSDVELRAPVVTGDAAVKRGEVGTWRLSHVNGCACVTVRNAEGKTVHTYRTREKVIRFAPAWNDGTGKFTLVVRSAVGGFVVEKSFEVK